MTDIIDHVDGVWNSYVDFDEIIHCSRCLISLSDDIVL